MAVIPKKESNQLILKIDNDDLTKMKNVLGRWNFKDEQSFYEE